MYREKFSLSAHWVRSHGSHAPSIRSHRGTKVVWPDFQPMRVPEEPVFIGLFRQNPVFTSLHLKSPVHVVQPLASSRYITTYFGGGDTGVSYFLTSLAQWCTATTPVWGLWQNHVQDCSTLFYTEWSCYKLERDYSSPAYTGRTNTCLSSLSVLVLYVVHTLKSFHFITVILRCLKKPILKLLPRKSCKE